MKKLTSILLIALLLVVMVSCTKKATTTPVAEAPKAEAKTEAKVEAPKAEAKTEAKVEAPKAEAKTEAKVEAPKTETPAVYVPGNDEEIYEEVLGNYEALSAAAKAAPNDDARFVLYAQSEAYLLDAAVMQPTTTKGGWYAMSRIAYRTKPYVNWGNDDDRWYGLVISEDFITREERADLIELYNKAIKGEATYDPAAYLKSKGHNLKKDYIYSFTTAPVTLDTLNTSSQSDTEILVQTVDFLVQYDNLGQMRPSLAESWAVSDDGLTYTFNIRKGVNWYTSEGVQYAEVTAEDFEAGFQHMLDAEAGLEWLVDGVIVGVSDYLYNGGTWDNVGYKAIDKYTLQVKLEQPTSYFLTMLSYSCFSPMCRSFFLSRGGVFGKPDYAEAYAAGKINYGLVTDVSSQVYNGAFLLQKLNADSEIKVVKNPGYYRANEVTLDSITWILDNGENPTQAYQDCLNGIYAGIKLRAASGLLDLAKKDGNFDKYAFVEDTESTTYFAGYNLNRQTFGLSSGAVASKKTEQQKIDFQKAILNKNFRKALCFAFDKETWNGVVEGAELALNTLRNMYTHPEFVQLSTDQTDKDGHTFKAGTKYGDMVQYYLDKMGAGITVADCTNGWFDAAAAKKSLAAAKAELGDSIHWPIHVEMVYYSASTTQVAQSQAYKQVIEKNLGSENVVVDLIEATTSSDYYAVGYRASNGAALGMDVFYGSGWGPDYGDPCSYLDTFNGYGAGYMTKVIGLF